MTKSGFQTRVRVKNECFKPVFRFQTTERVSNKCFKTGLGFQSRSSGLNRGSGFQSRVLNKG